MTSWLRPGDGASDPCVVEVRTQNHGRLGPVKRYYLLDPQSCDRWDLPTSLVGWVGSRWYVFFDKTRVRT